MFKKLLSEFRQFAVQGNAIDLAVGVIIGAGFKTIVDSVVKDFFTPIISFVTTLAMQREKFKFIPEDAWKSVNASISDLLSSIVNFLIIAMCVFFIVKLLNKVHKKEAKPVTEPALTKSEILLIEIRDLLKDEKHD